MALPSPSMLPKRTAGLVDPQRSAEYPVIFGESLRQGPSTSAQYVSLRYNWKSKTTFRNEKKEIKRLDDSLSDKKCQLSIHDLDSQDRPYKYDGSLRQSSAHGDFDGEEDRTIPLALIYSPEKSAFILESISMSIDFNLTSAQGQSKEQILARPQIGSGEHHEGRSQIRPAKLTDFDSGSDSEPDPNNPFDFRHFLAEARTGMGQNSGSRTPISGGLSAKASPALGVSRFLSVPSGATSAAKPRVSPAEAAITFSAKNTSVRKDAWPKVPKVKSASSRLKSKPPSKARISDSDEELSDTITLNAPTSHPVPKSSKLRSSAQTATSRAYSRSPRIEVDEAAGLEIDMGSPPRHGTPTVSEREKKRVKEAFKRSREERLGSGSPFVLAGTAVKRNLAAGRRDARDDVAMKDGDGDGGGDAEGEEEEDGDVEALELGSPRTMRAPVLPSTRLETVPVQRDDDEEGDDDELAAELEAALEEDGDADQMEPVDLHVAGRVGLGILGAAARQQQQQQDEESEVSEEE